MGVGFTRIPTSHDAIPQAVQAEERPAQARHSRYSLHRSASLTVVAGQSQSQQLPHPRARTGIRAAAASSTARGRAEEHDSRRRTNETPACALGPHEPTAGRAGRARPGLASTPALAEPFASTRECATTPAPGERAEINLGLVTAPGLATKRAIDPASKPSRLMLKEQRQQQRESSVRPCRRAR